MRNLKFKDIVKTSLRWNRKSWHFNLNHWPPAPPSIKKGVRLGGKGGKWAEFIGLPSGWSRMGNREEIEEGLRAHQVAHAYLIKAPTAENPNIQKATVTRLVLSIIP